MEENDSDYKALLAAPETLQRIRSACGKRFSRDKDNQKECVSFVLEKLLQDDCKRVRAYAGRASFNTFLHTCITRLIIDFVRHTEGRRRLPQAIARLGDLEQHVYMLLCWKGFSPKDAYEHVRCLGEYEKAFAAFVDELEAVFAVPCKENHNPESLTGEMGNDREISDLESNPLEVLLERLDTERRIVAAHVIRELTDTLPVMDQTLVRLIYAEGISVAKAACSLGLQVHVARNRLKMLLRLYKEKLLAKGIREA